MQTTKCAVALLLTLLLGCSDLTKVAPGRCDRLIKEAFNLQAERPTGTTCYQKVSVVLSRGRFFYLFEVRGPTCNGGTTVRNCDEETVCTFFGGGDPCADRFGESKRLETVGYRVLF